MRREILLKYMEEHRDEYLSVLEKLVRLESPSSGSREDLDRCRRFIAELFEGIGCTAEDLPCRDPKYADLLLVTYGSGPKTILFVGHYDTVHAKGSFGELWRQDNDTISGPGVLDMKSGIVMVFMALKAYTDLGLFPPDAKIVFLISGCEEAGSPSAADYYREYAKKAKATLVVEPSAGVVGVDPDDPGGIKAGRFGRGNYRLFAEGIPYHSGLDPTKAASALLELSHQAAVLEGMTFFDRVNERTGEKETVTVGCTSLHAGDADLPTIPGDGMLSFDARFSNERLAEEYDAVFRNLKPQNPKVSLKLSGGIEKPPFDPEVPGNRELQRLAGDLGREFGVTIKAGVARGGSDGNFTSAAGCPTLDGLGLTGSHMHQPGEYINVGSIPFRLAFTAELALRIMDR